MGPRLVGLRTVNRTRQWCGLVMLLGVRMRLGLG